MRGGSTSLPPRRLLAAAGSLPSANTAHQQGRNYPLPVYDLLSVQGSDHAQQFHVACRLSKPQLVVEGNGASRRKAEQSAATSALERLANHGN